MLLESRKYTYDRAELGLEVINTDVVLDLLKLGQKLDLRLYKGREFLLGDGGQLADKTEILVLNNCDGLFNNRFLDDQRVPFMSS